VVPPVSPHQFGKFTTNYRRPDRQDDFGSLLDVAQLERGAATAARASFGVTACRFWRERESAPKAKSGRKILRTIGTSMRKMGNSTEDRGRTFNHISKVEGHESRAGTTMFGEHDHEKRSALL
jgi:hypothetical protein